MDWGLTLLLGVIIFFSMGMEGITGFGGTVLALPFLSMLLPVKTAVNIVPLMSVCLGIIVIAQYYRKIQWRQLKTILIFAVIGIPVGIYGLNILPEAALKIILGLFVIFSSLKGFYTMRHPAPESGRLKSPLKRTVACLVLLLGGIFQGAFACGGPLFVIYVSREVKEKSAFRVTLSCVWVICNTLIFIRNLMVGGVYPDGFWNLWLCAFPFFIAGALVGNALHERVSVNTFTLIINIVLITAGISALAGAIGGII